MKKLLLLTTIILTAASAVIASVGMYSPEYVNHLKNCTIHLEKYNAEIPTADENTPVLHLTSTEAIAGWKEGKCITNSTVFSKDMNKEILKTQCSFNEKQLDTVVKKITAANKADLKDKQALQDELTKYVQDNALCRVTNLLENE